MPDLIPQERIESKIYQIRELKVMMDRDIAELYGVETKVLNQAVKRNIKRFPPDFMVQLTKEEMNNWKSQIVTSNSIRLGLRKRPFAFTEHGVLMLSSVLNSERAIQVNIQIMRTFTRLRQILSTHDDIKKKLEEHDKQFKVVFMEINKIHRLLEPPEKPKRKFGF
ncbi:MAG: ORF6N domain-containing protein [Candidatus Firestonebacteria bacterium]